ncbi:hypothetical protein AGMMS49992_26780 [Clostridia bacterium]|nr:hypothetical protein AGMMS49992_26780 [Clostridia bacterium]
MDQFNRLNSRTVTAWDHNVPRLVIKRCKHDGKRLRRLAWHRLKWQDTER